MAAEKKYEFKVKINVDMNMRKIVQNRTKLVKEINNVHRYVPAGITWLNVTKEAPQ